MASDNVVVNGKPIGADEITEPGVAQGTFVERVKLGYGPENSYVDVTTADPLPVTESKTTVTKGWSINVTTIKLLVPANPERLNMSIINTSTTDDLYLVFDNDLSSQPNWYSMVLYPQERYWLDSPMWTGAVYGYSSGASIHVVASEYEAGA